MDTSVTDNDAIVQTRGKIKKEKINEDIKVSYGLSQIL